MDEVVGCYDETGSLESTIVHRRSAMDLANLGGSWRMRSVKLIQHAALASRVLGLLVDMAGVV